MGQSIFRNLIIGCCLFPAFLFAQEQELNDALIREYLQKDCLVPPCFEYDDNYHLSLTLMMAAQVDGEIILSGICFPSFDIEYGVFISKDGERFLLTFIEAKEQIWSLRSKTPAETPSPAHLKKRFIEIPKEMADKLEQIWYEPLSQVKFDPLMEMLACFDGTSYEFSVKVRMPSLYLQGMQMNGSRKNILSIITAQLFLARDGLTFDMIPAILEQSHKEKRKDRKEARREAMEFDTTIVIPNGSKGIYGDDPFKNP